MSFRKIAFAALGAVALIAAAPAAFAGGRDDGHDGYGYDGPPPAPCHCEEVHLSDSFFYDQGGVGPAYDDYAGGGGGGGVVEVGGSAGASASAFASASASAKVSVGFHGQFHGNVRPPHPVNCRSGGGKRW
jgi:hypothetical protein